MRLLAVSHDAKTAKGEAYGFLTGILYLKPATRCLVAIVEHLGVKNSCPFATSGCAKACLDSAGRGSMESVQNGRRRKFSLLDHHWEAFWADLRSDVAALVRKAEREGLRPAVRLNGTSDLPWERAAEFQALCAEFPTVQFYDYTKWPLTRRVNLPANYDLTFSRSEKSTAADIDAALQHARVAVVFRHAIPAEWNGRTVIDGTQHDATFAHSKGVILGLIAKGKAKHDTSGFVLDTPEVCHD